MRNTTLCLKKSIHVEAFCRSRKIGALVLVRVYLDFSWKQYKALLRKINLTNTYALMKLERHKMLEADWGLLQ